MFEKDFPKHKTYKLQIYIFNRLNFRDYEKLKWNDIAAKMNYSEKQIRRYYSNYKNKKNY